MQKVYEGSCRIVEEIFSNLSTKKALLVCLDSYDLLPVKQVIEELDTEVVRFSEFGSNPLYEDVCKGVEKFNNENCDTILAIGGGSAIDVAKCIKLYSKMDKTECFLKQEYRDTHIPIIAIPTTAGTGSESTRYSVIYYEGNKQSVTHGSIIPDYVILDSTLLKNLPVFQKKCTLLDALCQGIESWWSINSTDESKKYSHLAVELIVKNMDKYIFDNEEMAAKQILLAANYSGKAINITQTTAAHAMSYKITSMFGLPHGNAAAICLPYVWEKMISSDCRYTETRGKDYLMGIFNDISNALGYSSSEEAINGFIKMLKRLEVEFKTELSEDELKTLVSSVNITRLSNNPVAFNEDDLLCMYERILKR